MVDFRNSDEREAWILLSASDSQDGLDVAPSRVHGWTALSPDTLFVGRVERHMLRAYRNGLARQFEELASTSLSMSLVDGSWLFEGDRRQSDRRFLDLCRRTLLMQRGWPVGRRIQSLLNDCRLQRVRGRALVVELATMAVRLSPSLQRRIVLVRALHEHRRYAEADALMASILAKPISSKDRTHAWILQSSLLRDRGLFEKAHVASRAALSCDGGSPQAWSGWLLTAALTESVQDLQSAGEGLAEACDSDNGRVKCFRDVHAGRYPARLLCAEWLCGLPKIAQRTLWEVFA